MMQITLAGARAPEAMVIAKTMMNQGRYDGFRVAFR